MTSLGTIERDHSSATGRTEWIHLIDSHPQLSQVADKQGINPFTKGAMEYKAARDCAHVLVEGIEIGMIHWAMDDSQRLVVWSAAGAEAQVAAVAENVASRLGWRYVREDSA